MPQLPNTESKQSRKADEFEYEIDDRRRDEKLVDLRSAAAIDHVHDSGADPDGKAIAEAVLERSGNGSGIDRTDRHRQQPTRNKADNKCDDHLLIAANVRSSCAACWRSCDSMISRILIVSISPYV